MLYNLSVSFFPRTIYSD